MQSLESPLMVSEDTGMDNSLIMGTFQSAITARLSNALRKHGSTADGWTK